MNQEQKHSWVRNDRIGGWVPNHQVKQNILFVENHDARFNLVRRALASAGSL